MEVLFGAEVSGFVLIISQCSLLSHLLLDMITTLIQNKGAHFKSLELTLFYHLELSLTDKLRASV
jgi:hypothetical protein